MGNPTNFSKPEKRWQAISTLTAVEGNYHFRLFVSAPLKEDVEKFIRQYNNGDVVIRVRVEALPAEGEPPPLMSPDWAGLEPTTPPTEVVLAVKVQDIANSFISKKAQDIANRFFGLSQKTPVFKAFSNNISDVVGLYRPILSR